jgi:hypothetical protein
VYQAICRWWCCQNLACRCRGGPRARSYRSVASCFELDDELGGYPAAVLDLDALVPGPVPDCGIVRAARTGLAAAQASVLSWRLMMRLVSSTVPRYRQKTQSRNAGS